ncbi:Peptidase A1 domain-containing protein [Mycena indigotica]|uniref:Peptidase A1 domain-containing protein n=1 Tax=Mycena indigotica TaxID=2126181 RepID=A0A8H6TEY8_9AGAR|nr:Peptidase A1 domain-containing protein [Mycena indigotica]KAF7316131.1 Peptidase A1 domain-containing protein [Mycena indigotica]
MVGLGLNGQAKGKARATARNPAAIQDTPRRHSALSTRGLEGGGGSEGIVLPLQYLEDGPYNIAYTLPVLVGDLDKKPKNFSLQVDTGSSDLWIASTACSSSACSSTPRYDPSITGTPAPADFNITYLVGSVSGPVYWDTVTVGGYSISNQALAAANKVDSEPLESRFSGILGLALPGNSIIADHIRPQTGDAPDGAVWASNLLSITPNGVAPSSPFLSVALERPGSDKVPSILGIGRHPAALVSDPSKISYEMLYGPTTNGPLFWKSGVHGITVYTSNSRTPITLGRGVSGTVYPSAVLDTGMPVILTTTAIADAIYGALSIQRAQDGFYYIPCTTPLNMTFTLDSREEIPLHPLDLSALPPVNSANPSSCIGLIQTSADATLRNPTSGIGDMVLGVPFMRNVYTVMAYDVPATNGTFPPFASASNTSNAASLSRPIRPRLGLLSLTDPIVAIDEFHRVRVLNQPLGGHGTTTPSGGGKKGIHNVGIAVLVGLGSFAGLCVLLFALRWFIVRRHLKRNGGEGLRAAGEYDLGDKKMSGTYRDVSRDDDSLPADDDVPKQQRYMQSLRTVSTDQTQIDAIPEGKDHHDVVQTLALHPQQEAEPVTPLPLSPQDHAPLLNQRAIERIPSSSSGAAVPFLQDEDGRVSEPEQRPLSMAGIGTARHRDSITSFARERSLSGLTATDERENYYSQGRNPDHRPGHPRRTSAGGDSFGSAGQAL